MDEITKLLCKICIALFLIFSIHQVESASITPEAKEENIDIVKVFKTKFVNATKTCSAILKVSPVEALQILTKDPSALMPTPEITKCYLLCLFQQFSLMDGKANYNVQNIENLLESLPHSRFRTVLKNNLENCLKENSVNKCDKGYKFAKCFYNNRELYEPQNETPKGIRRSLVTAYPVNKKEGSQEE